MIGLLRLADAERLKALMEHSNAMGDANRKLQALATDMNAMQETNSRLLSDNQELRDLCCFLDDDRQKGRKLAKEWQRFGRYTSSVMKSEVTVYQDKLKELESKQGDIASENK